MGRPTISSALAFVLALGTPALAQADRAQQRADFMNLCIAAAKKQLPDPATFRLNRAASQPIMAGKDGSSMWMFAFDAATKQNNVGHYNGFCTQQTDGTVSVTVA